MASSSLITVNIPPFYFKMVFFPVSSMSANTLEHETKYVNVTRHIMVVSDERFHT